MFSSYQAGYMAGRFFTRGVKFYLAGKVLDRAIVGLGRVAKSSKIDSKNSDMVTENVFSCLEYLD